jgi:hypothetical protein
MISGATGALLSLAKLRRDRAFMVFEDSASVSFN